MKEESNVLKHFTNVSVLFKILKGGFRFSDGANWDDKNDYFDIKTYSSQMQQNILVLCFCDGAGNVYHWNTLGRKNNNEKFVHIKCSIVLNKDKFLKYIDDSLGIYKHRNVIYCRNEEIKIKRAADIPFLKRKEFEVENEYRIIYSGNNDCEVINGIKPFIEKIVIGICSPLEYEEIKLLLTSKHRIPLSKIGQNKLTDSQEWQNNVKKLVKN